MDRDSCQSDLKSTQESKSKGKREVINVITKETSTENEKLLMKVSVCSTCSKSKC